MGEQEPFTEERWSRIELRSLCTPLLPFDRLLRTVESVEWKFLNFSNPGDVKGLEWACSPWQLGNRGDFGGEGGEATVYGAFPIDTLASAKNLSWGLTLQLRTRYLTATLASERWADWSIFGKSISSAISQPLSLPYQTLSLPHQTAPNTPPPSSHSQSYFWDFHSPHATAKCHQSHSKLHNFQSKWTEGSSDSKYFTMATVWCEVLTVKIVWHCFSRSGMRLKIVSQSLDGTLGGLSNKVGHRASPN